MFQLQSKQIKFTLAYLFKQNQCGKDEIKKALYR